MSPAYRVVTSLTVLANAGAAAADLAGADVVRATSADVGVPRPWVPPLAALQAAGAAGLVLGLLGARLTGLAAATGLVAYSLGAITAHLGARAFHTLAFPGAYLALAVASRLLGVRQRGTRR